MFFYFRFMGKGLVTELDHEKWSKRRLQMNPTFNRGFVQTRKYIYVNQNRVKTKDFTVVNKSISTSISACFRYLKSLTTQFNSTADALMEELAKIADG